MTRLNKKRSDGMLSIGQTVARLKQDFPGLSISKIRYFEDEGLIKPARTKGGYRLFSEDDIAALTEILRLQRDMFLPLAVIKKKMADWRPGRTAPADKEETCSEGGGELVDKPLLLDELETKFNIGTDLVRSLESFGLIKTTDIDDGLGVETEDVEILRAYARLLKFGIEPRHLRMYENLAQKEIVLFQQILTPQIIHKNRETRQKSVSDLQELMKSADDIRHAVLKKALKQAGLLQ